MHAFFFSSRFSLGALFLGCFLLMGCASVTGSNTFSEEVEGEQGHHHEEMGMREDALMDRPPLSGWERYEDANLRLRVDVPQGWTKESALFEGPQGDEWELRISNYQEPPQTCYGDLVEISILGLREKSVDQSLYSFVHDPLFYSGDRFVEGGKWSGDLRSVKVGGFPAYEVTDLGWERPCPGVDYIVEWNPSQVLLIETTVGTNASAQTRLDDILKTLLFKRS